MDKGLSLIKLITLSVALAASFPIMSAQPSANDSKEVENPVKRSEKALAFANMAFENASAFYAKGDIESGDAQLEEMTHALTECLRFLPVARKPQLYKKAEQNVVSLQRRIQSVVEDIQLQERGWAAYTDRKLDEIHDKLLEGALKK